MNIAVDPERILELHGEGFKVNVIAERLYVSERTVTRWLGKLKPDWNRASRHGRRLAPGERERMIELALEDVPSSWIAEDVGLGESTVNNFRRRMDLPSDAEWKGICQSIRRNPVLAKLHEEFRPK